MATATKNSVRLLLLLVCTLLAAQTKYFPPDTLSHDNKLNEFLVRWYSGQLAALQEPSLLSAPPQSVQSYRFLWLRTFNHPIAVRLDMSDDGTGTLTTKVASGAGGYAPGKLITNKTTPLDKAQVDSFVDLVVRSNFWNEPTGPNQQAGTDGAEWIIEGSKPGKYHVIDRWTPSKGAAYELGKKLAIDLAGLDGTTEPIHSAGVDVVTRNSQFPLRRTSTSVLSTTGASGWLAQEAL